VPDALYEQARLMADTLRHRGPDDQGVWTDPDAGVALGFRRLSILDLSPTGHQPMSSGDGRYVVVYNGEIYNFQDLREELEKRGAHFRGTSDTEVLLEGCSCWGPEATIPRLWGMFAIALWDRQERTLLLARDRLGKKPLYYWQDGATFLFGSELKALRAHPSFSAEIDRDALAAYLRFGYVPAPLCIYRNAHKLPQGCMAVVHAGHPPETRPYWDARQVVRDGLRGRLDLSDGEAADQLDTLLRDAVARRMIADVPLGAMLSGGFDSSTVVALMQAQSSRPVRTFTIGFHEAAYNEAEDAKEVARHLGTDHTELYVTPREALDVIPRLPTLYDEPFADSSQIPTFLVSALARRHVTVALSGDGGDELFGGYTRYQWADAIWRRVRRLPLGVRGGVARAIKAWPPERWDSLYGAVKWAVPGRVRQTLPGDKAHKLAELLTADRPDTLYHRLVSLWKSPCELVVGGQEPASVLLDPAVRELVPDFTERMMLLDLVTYLPDDILVKVDRASMGVSLEARCPLLDHRVVEWVWRLPNRFKNRDGQSKWLLRKVLGRYVPPELVERPKMGFGVPIDAWLRGPLREWAEELLDEGRMWEQGLLRPEPIRAAWAGHLSGRRNDQYRLWAVLMFQAWRAEWMQPSST
jgi:asparagine synthase (glutamine-hydrolysing)